MASIELLTVSLALKALAENGAADKALSLIDELLGSVRKLPPGHKLELLTELLAVKALIEGGNTNKATALIDEILGAMKERKGD